MSRHMGTGDRIRHEHAWSKVGRGRTSEPAQGLISSPVSGWETPATAKVVGEGGRPAPCPSPRAFICSWPPALALPTQKWENREPGSGSPQGRGLGTGSGEQKENPQ